jgi:hypothetical protein
MNSYTGIFSKLTTFMQRHVTRQKAPTNTKKNMSMDLLHQITHCPNVQRWYASPQSNNPCSKIISIQHCLSLSDFQVPEPWSGDLEHAPILFLSSNPSFDEVEDFPRWSWPDEWIEDFFINRFGGGRKEWIENGIRRVTPDGSRIVVSFWAAVRQRAIELLGNEVHPGKDYALTEVVHCSSRSEAGVSEALDECAGRYLQRVVKLSGAKVIVVLGSTIKNTVKREYGLSEGNVFGPIDIGERIRYLVFLPHPNAHMVRSFEKCIDSERLQEIRAFLRSYPY